MSYELSVNVQLVGSCFAALLLRFGVVPRFLLTLIGKVLSVLGCSILVILLVGSFAVRPLWNALLNCWTIGVVGIRLLSSTSSVCSLYCSEPLPLEVASA